MSYEEQELLLTARHAGLVAGRMASLGYIARLTGLGPHLVEEHRTNVEEDLAASLCRQGGEWGWTVTWSRGPGFSISGKGDTGEQEG